MSLDKMYLAINHNSGFSVLFSATANSEYIEIVCENVCGFFGFFFGSKVFHTIFIFVFA